MRNMLLSILLFGILTCLVGCNMSGNTAHSSSDVGTPDSAQEQIQPQSDREETSVQAVNEPYTKNTRISDVMNDPAFGDYGRLIFPVNSGYYSGDTLGDLSLTWYSHIDADKTVEIVNYFKSHADVGETIFYDIYTEEERQLIQRKRIQDCSSSKELPEKNLP